jgi:PAS domain S-box-containing protein
MRLNTKIIDADSKNIRQLLRKGILGRFFKESSEGFFVTTPEGEYVDSNPALARIYGYASSKVLIKGLKNIAQTLYVLPDRRRQFMTQIERDGSVKNFISQVRRKDGSLIWISEDAGVHFSENGQNYYWGTVRDITAEKESHDKIEKLAYTDFPTQLLNRIAIERQLADLMSQTQIGQNIGILVLSKDIGALNKAYGSGIGDAFLKDVARQLLERQKLGVWGRHGGGDFVCIMKNSGKVVLEDFAKNLLKYFENPGEDKPGIRFHAGGFVWHTRDRLSAEECLRRALQSADYARKQDAAIAIYNDNVEIEKYIETNYQIREDLKLALSSNEFYLHFQPKLRYGDNGVGVCYGAETLIRWSKKDSEGREISPGVFIPIAEQTGDIIVIGKWVIESALKQLQIWAQNKNLCHLSLAVNISAKQLEHPQFLASLVELLQTYPIDPKLLEFELTETAWGQDFQHVARVLKGIQELGIKLSLDDFGSGYAPFQYLGKIPFHKVKLDRGFIKLIEEGNEKQMTIAKHLISMMNDLGIDVVVEGVEEQKTIQDLLKLGYSEFQGYCIKKPVSLEDFLEFLKSN